MKTNTLIWSILTLGLTLLSCSESSKTEPIGKNDSNETKAKHTGEQKNQIQPSPFEENIQSKNFETLVINGFIKSSLLSDSTIFCSDSISIKKRIGSYGAIYVEESVDYLVTGHLQDWILNEPEFFNMNFENEAFSYDHMASFSLLPTEFIGFEKIVWLASTEEFYSKIEQSPGNIHLKVRSGLRINSIELCLLEVRHSNCNYLELQLYKRVNPDEIEFCNTIYTNFDGKTWGQNAVNHDEVLVSESLVSFNFSDDWNEVKNPLVATFIGGFYGDYFHLIFVDSEQIQYDFGAGNNNFGEMELYDFELDKSKKCYVNKEFNVYWDMKLSEFACCDGSYDRIEKEIPSIRRLEYSINQKSRNKVAQIEFEKELRLKWEDVPSKFVAKFEGLSWDRGGFWRIYFSDKAGNRYKFGRGDDNMNEFHLIISHNYGEEVFTNEDFLGQEFEIEWSWKKSFFYDRLKGENDLYEFNLKVPSIDHLRKVEK